MPVSDSQLAPGVRIGELCVSNRTAHMCHTCSGSYKHERGAAPANEDIEMQLKDTEKAASGTANLLGSLPAALRDSVGTDT